MTQINTIRHKGGDVMTDSNEIQRNIIEYFENL